MKQTHPQRLILVIGLVLILALGIFNLIEWTRPRVGTIVLPGGTTYLGPNR